MLQLYIQSSESLSPTQIEEAAELFTTSYGIWGPRVSRALGAWVKQSDPFHTTQ